MSISVFPYVIPSSSGSFEWAEGGMTLRDYFAGQALAGNKSSLSPSVDEAADKCYKLADAMMKARESKTVQE